MALVYDLGVATIGATIGMVDTLQTINPDPSDLSIWPVVYALGAMLIKEAGKIALLYVRAKYGKNEPGKQDQ